MRVHHRVLYLSMQSDVDRKTISQDWWDAFKFTRAVKSARINGFCHVPNGFFKQRIDEKNVSQARAIFGNWMMGVIRSEVANLDCCIVPVSSKDAVVNAAGPFRHMQMLDDVLAGHAEKPQIADVIRFTERLKKASEGGPRREFEIYPKMTIVGVVPTKPIILVDDVVTRGGHMNAAKRRLEEVGAQVICGVVCGRTVRETANNPWSPSIVTVDSDLWPSCSGTP